MKKLLLTTALVMTASMSFAQSDEAETVTAAAEAAAAASVNSDSSTNNGQDNILGDNLTTHSSVSGQSNVNENVLGNNNTYEQAVDHSTNTTVNHMDGSGDTHNTNVTNNQAQQNGYVSNPNLTTSGTDTCFGSSSGGISAAGIGISGGSTVVDENCVMLKNAKILASLGLTDAAVTLLIISNEDVAEAVSLANPELFEQLVLN